MSFTFGDTVRVKPGAPPAARPGALGEVVAITFIDTDVLAARYRSVVGTTFYLIEFGDGESTELPEELLERADG